MGDKPSESKKEASGASAAVQADPEKMLKEMLGAISSLTDGMGKIMNRLGAMEERFDGNRRVTMSRGGGSAEALSAGEFQDGQTFFEKYEQGGARYSSGSTGSNFGAKDLGTKLERPKFTVKNSFSKTPEGVKVEVLVDSDYLDFFR